MKKMSDQIVFFGSGPVAAESLRRLAESFSIEAVITKPRAPHHHGDVPVITVAQSLGLTIKEVNSRADVDLLFEGTPFKSNLGVLIDFGIFVSSKAISYFDRGIVNSHFSLLPEWRGADPITFSVLSGQKQTGVSLMLLVEAMDEGPILAQAVYNMPATITTPKLTDDLVDLSGTLLEEILPLWMESAIDAAPQGQNPISGHLTPTYSRKLVKEDGQVAWEKPADQLEREIRAFLAWPKSTARLHNLEFTITAAHVAKGSGRPGEALVVDSLPAVYCGKNILVLDKIKPSGKQEMTGQAFLAGYQKRFLEG